MIHCGQRARFTLEAREPFRIARERGGQHLERDVAMELRIVRAIHLAHAAGADRGDDFVRTDDAAGFETHRDADYMA